MLLSTLSPLLYAADNEGETGGTSQSDTATVGTYDALKTAIANEDVKTINLSADISISETLVISRDLVIDGKNGETNFKISPAQGFKNENQGMAIAIYSDSEENANYNVSVKNLDIVDFNLLKASGMVISVGRGKESYPNAYKKFYTGTAEFDNCKIEGIGKTGFFAISGNVNILNTTVDVSNKNNVSQRAPNGMEFQRAVVANVNNCTIKDSESTASSWVASGILVSRGGKATIVNTKFNNCQVGIGNTVLYDEQSAANSQLTMNEGIVFEGCKIPLKIQSNWEKEKSVIVVGSGYVTTPYILSKHRKHEGSDTVSDEDSKIVNQKQYAKESNITHKVMSDVSGLTDLLNNSDDYKNVVFDVDFNEGDVEIPYGIDVHYGIMRASGDAKVLSGSKISFDLYSVLNEGKNWSDYVSDYTVVYDVGKGKFNSNGLEWDSSKPITLPTTDKVKYKYQAKDTKVSYWLSSKNEQVKPGEKYTVTEDITFTAVYENEVKKVTFKTDESADGTTYLTLKDGKLAALPQKPIKSGYNFTGWYYNNAKVSKDTEFKEDAEVMARWSAIPTGGGSSSGGSSSGGSSSGGSSSGGSSSGGSSSGGSSTETVKEEETPKGKIEITVDGDDVKVSLGDDAEKTVIEAAGGKSVKLVVEKVGKEKLSVEQKSFVGKKAEEVVLIDSYVESEGKKLDVKTGKVDMSVKYEAKEGEKTENLVVWKLGENGEITAVKGTYDGENGVYKFSAEDMGKYALVNYPFEDVKTDDWYYEGAAFCYMNDMVNGVKENEFGADKELNRAMIVSVLYRLEGSPKSDKDMVFKDVKEGKYYFDPVKWASEKGIVKGFSEESFAPENELTREQMLSILYNYAKYKGYDVTASGDLKEYKDSDKVSDWAKESMSWGVNKGVVKGTGSKELSPEDSTLRGQFAVLMQRFVTMQK